jgi:Domain of unknown function (DUF4833)
MEYANGFRTADRLNQSMKFSALIFLLFAFAPPAGATDVSLFIVERTTNGNVVHYDARLTRSGDIDPADPIVVYWTIGSSSGKREDLSFLERHRAWGVNVRKRPDGHFVMTIVSQKQMEVEVYRKDGIVHAETSIAGSRAYLNKIFVNIEGPILFPKVNYIELFGSDVSTGVTCYERIIPRK